MTVNERKVFRSFVVSQQISDLAAMKIEKAIPNFAYSEVIEELAESSPANQLMLASIFAKLFIESNPIS